MTRMRGLPRSARPKRLLRILLVSEGVCNYRCSFCCFWNGEERGQSFACFQPEEYQFLAACMVRSGCDRVMLTGGEPLLFPRQRLLGVMASISAVPGINDFWLTTNGSLLDRRLAAQLLAAGLRRVVVTIAACCQQDYAGYAHSRHANLDAIFENIAAAVALGLQVRVDVPLSKDGVSSYGSLMRLLDRLKAVGVREVAYFRLHQTEENAAVFADLFVSADHITRQFVARQVWQLQRRGNGQAVFSDGVLEVIVPATAHVHTPSCRRNRCGLSCQGSYAAYLVSEPERSYVRACHGRFSDARNEFEIPRELLRRRDVDAVTGIFATAWKYAYGA